MKNLVVISLCLLVSFVSICLVYERVYADNGYISEGITSSFSEFNRWPYEVRTSFGALFGGIKSRYGSEISHQEYSDVTFAIPVEQNRIGLSNYLLEINALKSE